MAQVNGSWLGAKPNRQLREANWVRATLLPDW